MKWLFVLLLALIIFGGAAFFSYRLFFKQEIAVRHEQHGDVPAEPTPDVSLPGFQAAAKLRQEGKLAEARDALAAFIQEYPTGLHVEEAKDLLGEINIDVLLSRSPSPEKQEYIVKPGDTLSAICLLFYGNANKYPQVADAMGIDPNKLPVGKTLKLPVLS